MRADDATAAFARLGTRFSSRADAAVPMARGFGASALKRQGRIFAMLHQDRLVVKLPAARVAALIAEGTGEAFAGSRGAPMKEWIAVPVGRSARWQDLAEEAWRAAEPRPGATAGPRKG